MFADFYKQEELLLARLLKEEDDYRDDDYPRAQLLSGRGSTALG